MADTDTEPRKPSPSNTKKEILKAYEDLLKRLEEERKAKQRPPEKIEERRVEESVETAETLSNGGISQEIGELRLHITKTLVEMSDRLEAEVEKYRAVSEAVRVKEAELQEIYEIQKSAMSVTALFELAEGKRAEIDVELGSRRRELEEEIETARAEWKKEKRANEEQEKESRDFEQKKRKREKEEYEYAFKREQEMARQGLDDELAKLRRELEQTKVESENALAGRERIVSERESELEHLKQLVETFPQDEKAAIDKAVAEALERVAKDTEYREELLKKELDGERKVLTSQIEALEKTVSEQSSQIAKLAQQLEKSYGQVQDIAVKAIEGSSDSKSLARLQGLMAEQARKSSGEK